MKIAIIMEGGLIQHIVADGTAEIVIIDYDTEGADEDRITDIPQDGGGFAEAYVSAPFIDEKPARASELVALYKD